MTCTGSFAIKHKQTISSVGWQAKIYIYQVCVDTEESKESMMLEHFDDTEEIL